MPSGARALARCISDPPARTWLQKTFDDIEAAIRASLIWSSELITGEPQQGTRH